MRQRIATSLKGLCSAALAAALVAPFAGAGAASMPGEGVTVKPARATWDTGWFQTEIYIKALEELGYDVKRPTTLDNPPFYQAVAQGDVDFWVNGWFPLHNTYRDTFEQGASTVSYVAKGGALQGYLVSKGAADELDIETLEDFKRPAVRKRFDGDGNGKAEMVACPPGWGCELVIEHQLDAYGLRDHIEPIKASYAASMADAMGRYKNGKPILFYTWTPNWTVGMLEPGKDVVWIGVDHPSLPDDQKQYEDDTTVSGVTGCVSEPCPLGWPANDIRPVVNDEFLAENPAAEKLFEVVRIPLEDIYAQNARMFNGEDDAKDLIRHANTWIENNRETFDGWLRQAREAAES